MSLYRCTLVLMTIIALTGCERDQELTGPATTLHVDVPSFSEFFIEKGTDSDLSYISLRGEQKDDGILELQATSWGIRETGLFLHRANSFKSATFVFMGECGTISSRTWEKATIVVDLTAADQDTLWRIAFTSHADTIELVKTHIGSYPGILN